MVNDSHCFAVLMILAMVTFSSGTNAFIKLRFMNAFIKLRSYLLIITQNEIDYISISSRWRSLLQEVRIYRGADCGIDHFLVIAKMRLKFKRLKQAEKKMIFNTTRLKDTNTRFRYWLKVRNKFSYLEETDDIEVRWSNFKDAVHTAADSIIGWRWSILKEQWRSNKSWILKNKKKQKQIQMRPDSFW